MLALVITICISSCEVCFCNAKPSGNHVWDWGVARLSTMDTDSSRTVCICVYCLYTQHAVLFSPNACCVIAFVGSLCGLRPGFCCYIC